MQTLCCGEEGMMTTMRIDLEQTGVNIYSLRVRSCLTVRDLQNVFGFSTPQAIYKWQKGECLPTVDNLVVLARLFHTNMESILVVVGDLQPVV